MKLCFDTEVRDLTLLEYMSLNKFTDMVLLTRNKKIDVHSAILTHFCPSFAELIKNHFVNFEDIIVSVPEVTGEEMAKALEDVYLDKNCDHLSSLLGLGNNAVDDNSLKTEPKLEEGLERFLAGLPVKVVLKSEPEQVEECDNDELGSEHSSIGLSFNIDQASNDLKVNPEKEVISDSDTNNYSASPIQPNLKQSLSLKLKVSPKKGKLTFNCSQCDLSFTTRALLTKHNHQIHWESYGYSSLPTNIVVCTGSKGACLEVFLSQDQLADHKKTFHLEKSRLKAKSHKYQCEECGKKISSPECLRLHVDAIHRGIKHPCPHCPYSTGWPKNLHEHIMFYHTHVNDESILKYQCSICGKKFKRQNSLAEHELTHNPKTFKCSHCNRGFSHDRYLERHVVSVHGDRKFPCEICGKKFTTQEYVKTHYNSVHLEHSERRHKCDICGQGFNKKMAFRSHMNKHQGLKPFLCPASECDKCFSDDTAWSHHKRNCPYIRFNKENPPVN